MTQARSGSPWCGSAVARGQVRGHGEGETLRCPGPSSYLLYRPLSSPVGSQGVYLPAPWPPPGAVMASPLCPCGSCMVFWVSSCPRLTVLNSACPHAHATLALAVTGLSAWAAVRARWHLPQYHLHYCWVASVQHGPPVVEGAACPKPVLSVLSPDQRAHGVLAHVEASAHREPPPYRCHGVDVLGVSHCSHGSKGHQESCFPSAQAYSPGEARPLLFPVPWEEVWTPPPLDGPKGSQRLPARPGPLLAFQDE